MKQVATDDRLALLYNDISVLENHHAYYTFQLLRRPECNIFAEPSIFKVRFALSPAWHGSRLSCFSCVLQEHEVKSIRKSIIGAILATDMAHHKKHCIQLDCQKPLFGSIDRAKVSCWTSLHCLVLSNISPARHFAHASPTLAHATPLEQEEDRQFVVNTMVHCGDLSGQVYPLHIAEVWEERVSQEFHLQAKEMAALGLEVPRFLQGLDSVIVRAKGQVGFIDWVMSPLWRGAKDMFGQALQQCLDNLLFNRQHYVTVADQKEQKAESATKVAKKPGFKAVTSQMATTLGT